MKRHQPQKLLIIMPTRARGGVEEHALSMGTAAVADGWQVIAAFPKLPETQTLTRSFAAAGIRHQPLTIAETEVPHASTLLNLISTLPLRLLAWVEKPWHFVCVMVCLLRDRPDVVMLNLAWADKGLTSMLACALLNQPATVVFHLIPWPLHLPALKRKLYQWMGDRAQSWVGISENNRQLISESFQRPVESIERIYNGTANGTGFSATKCLKTNTRKALRQSLSIPENSTILLTVARLVSQKGHDYLIPTIPHLLAQFPNIHFVWVGTGDQKESLEASLDSYGVRSAVTFLGHSNNVPDLLQAADLFVLPTYFEGFPFALLEAMAHGLPVVTTAVNGIPEIVEHNAHGLLTRKGDSCDLLEKLRWALAHPHKMTQMAQNASHRIQDFSAEAMTAQTLRLLSRTAQRHRPLDQPLHHSKTAAIAPTPLSSSQR